MWFLSELSCMKKTTDTSGIHNLQLLGIGHYISHCFQIHKCSAEYRTCMGKACMVCWSHRYMVFFLYRYYISEKRKKVVQKFQMIEKVRGNACLTHEDREVFEGSHSA